MVFSTDSYLSYTILQYKSEKVHGLFGLGWKNQEHTVRGDVIYGLPLKARIMGPHKDEPRTKGVSLVFPFCKGMKKV